ncbi:phosphoglycolate phosphatase [Luteimonas aestuarii]|uniref:Phosphoglycolate phosphatase n=1 Tax=Luteimonas aestuarii TaxID=453837 RepID=A0A4R5TSJ7_9GAMM|nr:phosphoglycolate phosphatase [Luteimonas aestuarii]TDK23227.1 phosphoglycolate phosphatase [Luteimonas aestuarii]
MPSPLRAALFDLDGTLIDSATGIASALNHTLQALGHAPEPETLIRTWIGDGARQLLRQGLQHAGGDLPDGEAFESAYALLMRHYADSLPLQARAYPGAEDALQGLHARGVRVALCTNKPQRFIAPLFEALGWNDLFDAVVGGDTLPVHKPDPEPLWHIARGFGIDPAQSVMVGDSRTDAEAARAAGMPLVLVDYGYRRGYDLQTAGALQVTADLRSLLDLAVE